MKRSAYKTSIPAQAAEVIDEYHANGVKSRASYVLAGEVVGHRAWVEDGHLDSEYGMSHGNKHSPVYFFHDNGQVMSREIYRNGTLHGICKQWAEDGRLLVTWKMVNGTGLDLWCNDDGTLIEALYYKEGEPLYQRFWADEKTLMRERLWGSFVEIRREWTISDKGPGRLKRGFPHFYLKGVRVTKREYVKACKADPSLLPYRPEDDDPHRELPAEYLAQRKNKK
jgi:hypothetical protein